MINRQVFKNVHKQADIQFLTIYPQPLPDGLEYNDPEGLIQIYDEYMDCVYPENIGWEDNGYITITFRDIDWREMFLTVVVIR